MNDIEGQPSDLEGFSELLRVLAEPKRLMILQLLMEGVQCNCELGDALHMPPNLISHHLRVLREAGLVDMERDPVDARWIYYSINRSTLAALNTLFGRLLNVDRIKPRRPTCGPGSAFVPLGAIEVRGREQE
jgi:ArsR family transcriptional regulator, arsenate/arsenite/antimonite-responsive transcriptional repressor